MLVSMVSSSKIKKSQSIKGKLFPKLDYLYFYLRCLFSNNIN